MRVIIFEAITLLIMTRSLSFCMASSTSTGQRSGPCFCTGTPSIDKALLAQQGTQKAKTEVVVAVAGLVVVAVRRSAVLGVVIPASTTIDPVGASHDHCPKGTFH